MRRIGVALGALTLWIALLPGAGVSQESKSPTCAGKTPTKIGTKRADKIQGTSRNDVILALGGKDTITDEGGGATVCGGEGADTITIGKGAAFVSGGAGEDVIVTGARSDKVLGGAGNDLISGGDGTDRLIGGDDNDRLVDSSGSDFLDGSAGADSVDLSMSAFPLDVDLEAGWARFVIDGEATNQTKLLNIENIYGSLHDDKLAGTEGANAITAGAGNDIVDSRDGPDRLDGGTGDDTFLDSPGDDEIIALEGNDTIADASGFNIIDGGEGIDRLDISAAKGPARVDIPGGGSHGFGLSEITVNRVVYQSQLTGMEDLVGTSFDDEIYGTSGDEHIDSGAGDDEIDARTGNDVLVAGAGDDYAKGYFGDDRIEGGEGFDTCSAETSTDCERLGDWGRVTIDDPFVPEDQYRQATVDLGREFESMQELCFDFYFPRLNNLNDKEAVVIYFEPRTPEADGGQWTMNFGESLDYLSTCYPGDEDEAETFYEGFRNFEISAGSGDPAREASYLLDKLYVIAVNPS